MVSVPVIPADNSVGAVLPGVEIIYAWDATTGSYYVPTEIETHTGYWVAVVADMTIPVEGTRVETWTTGMSAGWNLVGSIYGTTVDFTSPNDDPDGGVEPFVYWWNPVTGQYELMSTIEPAVGYWVAATQDCTLALPCPRSTARSVPEE